MTRLKDFDSFDAITHAAPLDTIEDQEVSIIDASIVDGRFGVTLLMQVQTDNDHVLWVRTGSTILIPLMRRAMAEGQFPFEARFVRSGRAWTVE